MGNLSFNWITTYILQYSSNGSSWENVTSGESGDAHIFTGNSDATSWVEQVFDEPITARYVRLNALTWVSRAAGKWQLVNNGNCSGMNLFDSNSMRLTKSHPKALHVNTVTPEK